MIVRKLTNEDVGKLLELQARFNHKFDLAESIGTAVAEETGQIVAIGALFPRLEAAILVDSNVGRKSRADAISRLHNVAVEVAQVHGASELVAISPSEIYTNFLVKRLGFERLVGQPLILELPR